MPIPLIPIISALATGGTLVPHAAGGLIVTGASGYITGTFLSTAAIGCGYGGYRLFKLKRKLNETPEGEEAQFTETEAKMVEKVIKQLAKKGTPDSET